MCVLCVCGVVWVCVKQQSKRNSNTIVADDYDVCMRVLNACLCLCVRMCCECVCVCGYVYTYILELIRHEIRIDACIQICTAAIITTQRVAYP